MILAIFDLDSTLINGDSDHAWGEFLAHKNIVGQDYRQGNDRFYADYKAGRLDMAAYIEFLLQPLMQFDWSQLNALRQEFVQTMIEPMRLPRAEKLLASHRDRGHTLLIITSTNRIITEPIAALLGVDHLLATDLEISQNRLTGRMSGTPCFHCGKVSRLEDWLERTGHSLKGSFFYTDSHTDLPLLKIVDNPVAVDPDPDLAATARARGWPVISLR